HEREIFRMLLSVSGIGANTARMMLSSLTPSEVEQAILEGNVALLKSIKGIGTKSAQRVIVDLKDKIGKGAEIGEVFALQSNTIKDESLSALVMLGFSKTYAQKVIDKILFKEKDITVEELIKKALKEL
ncbi:MAG: Holliday junction branch migration protein RuvA, partial [Bacteroidales bacterium]|nr:Holliday junction branch migration protein RuvA [Bacteroidales bacterium]